MFGFFKSKWHSLLPPHLQYLTKNQELKKSLDSYKKRCNLTDAEFCGVILSTRTATIAAIKSNWNQIATNEPNYEEEFYAKKTLEDRVVKIMLAVVAAKDSGQMTAGKLEVSAYLNDNIETLLNTCDSQKSVIDISIHIWKMTNKDNSPHTYNLIQAVDGIIINEVWQDC